MDFITNLPFVGGYDPVFVMVNRFIKMAHFVPCAKTITEEETTDLFFKNVVRLHGLQNDITSDRGHNLFPISGDAFCKPSVVL